VTGLGGASPPDHSVSFGGQTIRFTVKRSNRKTLAITVHPDLSVTVTAPASVEAEAVREKVKRRAPWILRQREYFKEYLPAVPARRYVSGETHYYLGRQYRLKVASDSDEENVKLKGGYIHIRVRGNWDEGRVRALLQTWLRDHAESHFERRLRECWGVMRKYGVNLPQMRLRKMTKRWGSCGGGGVIYLNPELVRTPRRCIDYVITHELCHLKHANHGEGFRRLLRRVMPDWERWKEKLEKFGGN
jgi:predicted metal-dependent hydrolase